MPCVVPTCGATVGSFRPFPQHVALADRWLEAIHVGCGVKVAECSPEDLGLQQICQWHFGKLTAAIEVYQEPKIFFNCKEAQEVEISSCRMCLQFFRSCDMVSMNGELSGTDIKSIFCESLGIDFKSNNFVEPMCCLECLARLELLESVQKGFLQTHDILQYLNSLTRDTASDWTLAVEVIMHDDDDRAESQSDVAIFEDGRDDKRPPLETSPKIFKSENGAPIKRKRKRIARCFTMSYGNQFIEFIADKAVANETPEAGIYIDEVWVDEDQIEIEETKIESITVNSPDDSPDDRNANDSSDDSWSHESANVKSLENSRHESTASDAGDSYSVDDSDETNNIEDSPSHESNANDFLQEAANPLHTPLLQSTPINSPLRKSTTVDTLEQTVIDAPESTVNDGSGEKGVTRDDLPLPSSEDVNQLFDSSRTGEKRHFRHRLANWPDSILHKPAQECCSKRLRFTKSSIELAHLETLLKTNEKGKIITKHYAAFGSLSKLCRKQLCEIICDAYIAEGKPFPVADMEQFSELIAAKFPTESKETYLCPRDMSIGKCNPSGLLYNKYFNSVDRKTFVPSQQKKRKTVTETEAAILQNPEDLKSVQEDHAWLLNNNCPADDVRRRWEKTIRYRSDQIKDLQKDPSRFSKIVESWPRYKDKDGLLYIDIDYTALNGNCGKDLLANWSTFGQKLLSYAISSRISDKASHEIIEKLQRPDISACSRNFLLYKLFPAVIKPKRIRGSSLPSILQAQSDGIVHCFTANDVGPAIEELKRNKTSDALQPTIIVVGAEDTQLTQFYVVKNGVIWKPCSFLKCIDLVVKTCRVFKLEFSPYNELFWVFLRTHFMHEEAVKHSKCSALVALQNILKE